MNCVKKGVNTETAAGKADRKRKTYANPAQVGKFQSAKGDSKIHKVRILKNKYLTTELLIIPNAQSNLNRKYSHTGK